MLLYASMEPLSSRQEHVLNAVVQTHIETALPVGSRCVTGQAGLECSPATVRNEMGQLEDLGFLEQPHTSSGRVPTDQGYRYYVDHCLNAESFEDRFLGEIENSLAGTDGDIEEVAEEASGTLAQLSHEISLILTGEQGARRGMKLYVRGSSYLFEKPEFRDVEKIRGLFFALEEKMTLVDWLMSQSRPESVSVRIGHENEPEVLRECSLISSPCTFDGRHLGAIAIIGPRRIRYQRAVPLVEQMAGIIGRILSSRVF